MTKNINKIGVFCGSNSGNAPNYTKAAEELADALCSSHISLVYGGAKVGLMGAIADRMIQNKGEATGVIPQFLVEVEVAHESLTQLIIVNSMHERKAKIFEIADAFIMLPGGAGSLDEFFEMFTWSQLKLHKKPCGILNTNGYYDYLLKFLDHAEEQGFIKKEHRNRILVDDSPINLINSFTSFQYSDGKWEKSMEIESAICDN